LIEALILANRVGETFAGTIIAIGTGNSGTVMLRELAIEARATWSAAAPLGADVRVKLVEADPSRRTTLFEVVG
jgi:exoribonuclease R